MPRALPRPAWEHIIPLPDPDRRYGTPEMTYELFTSPSQWFVFPVGESGMDTLVKCSLIEMGRDLRARWTTG